MCQVQASVSVVYLMGHVILCINSFRPLCSVYSSLTWPLHNLNQFIIQQRSMSTTVSLFDSTLIHKTNTTRRHGGK